MYNWYNNHVQDLLVTAATTPEDIHNNTLLIERCKKNRFVKNNNSTSNFDGFSTVKDVFILLLILFGSSFFTTKYLEYRKNRFSLKY